MPLTPEDFEGREFLVTLRGYDKDEVQAFLEEAARDYRAALKGANRPQQVDQFENLGREVGSVLQAAQESAAKIRAEGEEEAARLRENAESEIDLLKEQTANAARQLREEAEVHAAEVRSRADAELLDLESGSVARLTKVKEVESELRERLLELEKLVAGVRREVETAIEKVSAKGSNDSSNGGGNFEKLEEGPTSTSPTQMRKVTPAADLG